MKTENPNIKAYWYGWKGGRYGEECCFTEYRWVGLEAPGERLDLYRGHRARQKARQHSGDLLRPRKTPPRATDS